MEIRKHKWKFRKCHNRSKENRTENLQALRRKNIEIVSKIETGNNEMMDSQSQLKANISYIQANQEEQKEALNNLEIIINVTSHNNYN
jgi:hypothetical protein